jgi:hypothetical protein
LVLQIWFEIQMGALTCTTILVLEAQSHNCLDQDNIMVIVLTLRTNWKPSFFYMHQDSVNGLDITKSLRIHKFMHLKFVIIFHVVWSLWNWITLLHVLTSFTFFLLDHQQNLHMDFGCSLISTFSLIYDLFEMMIGVW